jgi:hypothetical protein
MNEYLWITLLWGYVPILLSLNKITKNTTQLEKNTDEMLKKMNKVDLLIEKIREY